MTSSSNLVSLGGTPEASEFGAALRDMRVAHKTDLSTVASTLRIRQVYLQAIEDGRFDDLPGPTYAAGFVRAYAEYLGLEIAETMQRYRDVTGNASAQVPLVAPSPVVEGRMPTGFILLVAAMLAAAAYGSWYYLSLDGRDAGDLVAKLPEQIADMVGLGSEEEMTAAPLPAGSEQSREPAPQTSSMVDEKAAIEAAAEEPAAASPAVTDPAGEPAAPPQAAPQSGIAAVTEMPSAPPAETPGADAPGQRESASSAAPPEDNATVESGSAGIEPAAVPERPVATANSVVDQAGFPVSAERGDAVEVTPLVTQQAALPEAPAAAPPAATSRVVLRATAISWVELRDGAGKRVFSRLLKKGETYNVPAQSGITLATGNAGALDILVDGQVVPPIGPLGAVRRDILLEPAALLERRGGGG